MAEISDILRELAEGRIDAAEAERLIDEAQSAARSDEGQPADATPGPDAAASRPGGDAPVEAELVEEERPAGANGVDAISVRVVGRRLRVIGDPSVSTLVADGPHTMRRRGRILEVSSDGELGPSLDAFTMFRVPRTIDDLRNLGLNQLGFGRELVLRVNPAIPVDLELTAGTLATTALPRLGKVRITGGNAHLSGVETVEDVLVQAGSATIRGNLRRGRSRVRVESGQLTVDLGPQADVTVRADAQMGKVIWPGEQQSIDEYVAGEGTGRLDIGVVMGFVTVRAHGTHPGAERGPGGPGDPAWDDFLKGHDQW
ncbi:MAG: hypothetical protein M0Z51_15585 [Propionibacterium sp.]|nr:hypothetical protein [Propionibacterium sp.]